MAASPAEVRALTQAYRTQQVQRAALVATLVAAYYRSRVDPEDAAAVEEWLDLMLPRIIAEYNRISGFAASYATRARSLELPDVPSLRFEPGPAAVTEQIRRSLLVVGPADYLKKATDIRTLEVPPAQQTALLRQAKQETAKKIAASTVRHTQNGGRNTLIAAAKADDKTLGYVRVTKAKPCFFCAMLASRGLVFAEDSFDLSDPRFTGAGTAKVHDSCQCGMKPVWRREDPLLADTAVYTDLWSRWGAGGGDAALRFRRGYEHWLATGEYLDYDIVDDAEAYRNRLAA